VMPTASTLRGRVLDPNGQPVAGALVSVGRSASLFSIEGLNAMRTDKQGQYEFNDLNKFDSAKAAKQGTNVVYFAVGADPPPTPPKPIGDPLASAIIVQHLDYAIARQIAGDIPGTYDVTLQAGAEIRGRIVHANDGRPAANFPVRIVGQSRTIDSDSVPKQQLRAILGPYNAMTKTDHEGRYRFANLPIDQYKIDPQESSVNIMKAKWVGRGMYGIRAKEGETTEAADLKIGRGGLLRGQLIDAVTGKPPLLGKEGAKLSIIYFLADTGQTDQTFSALDVDCSPEGFFAARTPPGKFRVLVFVDIPRQGQPGSQEYRSSDNADSSGPVQEIADGETIDTKVEVYSAKVLEAMRQSAQRGYKLYGQRKLTEAVEQSTEALAKHPKNDSALLGRARCYEQLRDFPATIADYETMIQRYPQQPSFMNSLAHLLATCPDESLRDGPRAIRLAEEMIEFYRQQLFGEDSRSLAQHLDTLAAAQAEMGDFSAAIITQQQAIQLNPKYKNFHARLELYQAGKPYHREVKATGQ